jgi:hypothetical protein
MTAHDRFAAPAPSAMLSRPQLSPWCVCNDTLGLGDRGRPAVNVLLNDLASNPHTFVLDIVSDVVRA